ncbi:MAG: tRNA (adenine(22)-N(1))-methyltransferase [Bacillota bacterium]
MIKLSKRLNTIAGFVPLGTAAADIGTDHALLPCYLIQEKISPFAVAVDVSEGPFQAAQKQVCSLLLADRVSVRLGNGLEPIEPGEVQTVTIAGMGGASMVKILNKGSFVVSQLQRIILQPNVAAENIRHWALENSWNIIDEELVLEDERFYEIIVLEPGYMDIKDDTLLFIGPKLLEKYHILLVDYLKLQKRAEQEILTQLEKSNSQGAVKKAAAIKEKWIKVGQVIKCHLNVEI